MNHSRLRLHHQSDQFRPDNKMRPMYSRTSPQLTTYVHNIPPIQIPRPLPRPLMVPPIPRRRIRLRPRILNRDATHHPLLGLPPSIIPLLRHRLPIQPATGRKARVELLRIHTLAVNMTDGQFPQLLARAPHAVVLALELEGLGQASLGLVELPGAVDGPVAEGAEAGEAQGSGG